MCAVCAKGYPGVVEILLPLIGVLFAVIVVPLLSRMRTDR